MCVTFVPVTYNDYVYPVGAQAIGFMMALASMLCIPGYAVYALLSANGSLSEVCHLQSLSSTLLLPSYVNGVYIINLFE